METNNSPELKYRDGRTFAGTPTLNEKGKPYTSHVSKCSRCGGAGGSDKWKHTGWTCFQCGGSRLGPVVVSKLYTQAQLDKLNATRDKKQAAKAVVQAAAQVAREADKTARRGTFVTTNAELFATAAKLDDEFINTMVAQCIDRVSISPAQAELINRKVVETARKAAASHVGVIGKRREFTCTLQTFREFAGLFGRCYLHVMRDEQGNTVKYMGSAILANVKYNSDAEIYEFNKEETFKFTATVKAHEYYSDEPQTVVARPKEGN